MKYDLSKIMTNAWNIRRTENVTMSYALKKVWAAEKVQPVSIKGWFMTKNFSDHERLAMIGAEQKTLRETEKAVQICWNTNYGKIIRWVPKSCLETAASYATENTAEKCAARLADMQARQASYEALIAKCRKHGVPARKGWRVATMRQKLAEVVA